MLSRAIRSSPLTTRASSAVYIAFAKPCRTTRPPRGLRARIHAANREHIDSCTDHQEAIHKSLFERSHQIGRLLTQSPSKTAQPFALTTLVCIPRDFSLAAGGLRSR